MPDKNNSSSDNNYSNNKKNPTKKSNKDDITFDDTLDWAKKGKDDSKMTGGYGLYFVIGGIILIMVILWLVIIYTAKSEDSNAIQELNNINQIVPPYIDDDYSDYTDADG